METCKYGLGASTRKPPTARWVWRWVLSPHKNAFCLFFKKSTNEPFTVYLNHFRLQMATTLLNRTDQNISEIAYSVGFADIPYFNRCFKKEYGITPAEYRNKYRR